MALDLRVPTERAALPAGLELRPKQVRAWIESLPLSQSAEVGRRILANLGATNRARVAFDERLQLLEAYWPIAQTAFEELDAVYGKAALPLPPRAREALALARSLATEFAYGYKILILEKTGRLLGFGAKRQMPLLLHRAMASLGHLLNAGYRSYTPVPAGTWREIHLLYLHAEKEGLAAGIADPAVKSSVADLYAEILLVSLTDPYRLVPGELFKVAQVIRSHRGAYTIGQSRPATPPGAHFLAPCDQDKPPKPLLSANDDTGGPDWRLIDANPLVDKLRARREAVEAGNVSATTSKAMSPDMLALLDKLVTLWGDPPKRNYRRDPLESRVAICAGLGAIIELIATEPRLHASRGGDDDAGHGVAPAAAPDDARAEEWDVVNRSTGGLKVRRVGPAAQAITVGEVLGIKLAGRAHRTIGTVRWITMLEEGGMEIGIQFLAAVARCVAVQPPINAASQVRPGLLLFSDEASHSADALLTQPSTYADLREFEVEEDGRVSRVRATRLVERTSRFEMFRFIAS